MVTKERRKRKCVAKGNPFEAPNIYKACSNSCEESNS